jgi:hypothetical protein
VGKIKMTKAVYFDMDGTIADLYGQKGWLDKLRAENPEPYIQAREMVDMVELHSIIEKLQAKGVKVGVITWLSKFSSKEYKRKVRQAKKAWLKAKVNAKFDFIHVVQYGTPKHKVAKITPSIIVDDDEGVLGSWTGGTIDAKNPDWISELRKLADE